MMRDTKRLDVPKVEFVPVTAMWLHVIYDGGSRDHALPFAHATEGMFPQLPSPASAPGRARIPTIVGGACHSSVLRWGLEDDCRGLDERHESRHAYVEFRLELQFVHFGLEDAGCVPVLAPGNQEPSVELFVTHLQNPLLLGY
jgi:hypothetical protein